MTLTLPRRGWTRGGWLALLLLASCSTGAMPEKKAGIRRSEDRRRSPGRRHAGYRAECRTPSILQSNPRDVGALERQGTALAQLGQPDAAMEAWRRALAINPAAPVALLGLGRMQLPPATPRCRNQFHEAARCHTRRSGGAERPWRGARSAGEARGGAGDISKTAEPEPERSCGVGQYGPVAVAQRPGGPVGRDVTRGPGSQPDAAPRVRQDLAVALVLSGDPTDAEKLPAHGSFTPSDAAAAAGGLSGRSAITRQVTQARRAARTVSIRVKRSAGRRRAARRESRAGDRAWSARADHVPCWPAWGAVAVDLGRGYLAKTADQRVADSTAYAGALAYNSSGSTITMNSAIGNLAALNGLPAGAASGILVASPSGDGNQAVEVTVTTSVAAVAGRRSSKAARHCR